MTAGPTRREILIQFAKGFVTLPLAAFLFIARPGTAKADRSIRKENPMKLPQPKFEEKFPWKKPSSNEERSDLSVHSH